MHDNDPWATRPTTYAEKFHALCIRHENGVVHVRSTIEGYPRAGWALTRDHLAWVPDISLDEATSAVVVRDLRLGDAGADAAPEVEDIVAALRRSNMLVHGYSPYYDTHGKGPTVKYRRAAETIAHDRHRYLHSIDYGFDAGCWYFGHPAQLERALCMAREGGIVAYEVRDADLESFAIDATGGATRWLNSRFEREEGVVHHDEFRPSGP